MGPHLLLIPAISITACSKVGSTTIAGSAVMDESDSGMNADCGNLSAIKALLARDREQFGRSSNTSAGKAVEPFHQAPLMSLHPANGSELAFSKETTSAFPNGLFLLPSQTAQHHLQVSQVQRIPTQRSSSDHRIHQSPPVPPYTMYAPLGSVYPGAIRCVPDYLGGQRCHNMP
jgi:hypothetical protein